MLSLWWWLQLLLLYFPILCLFVDFVAILIVITVGYCNNGKMVIYKVLFVSFFTFHLMFEAATC